MQAQLTPEQAQELYDFLEGPDGCDFQQSDPETASWLCDGTLTKTYAWLNEHNIVMSAIYWRSKCDCEVIFNFPRDLLPYEGE